MTCLECYTLTDRLTKGIRVADFESIITESADMETVRYAAMQTCPLFELGTTTIEMVTPLSLCFLQACSKPPRKKGDGVIIAVDMEQWQLAGPDDASSVIDPCGPGGKALLYYPPSSTAGLLNREQSNKCLVITEKSVPTITRINRANLLAAAAGVHKETLKPDPPAQTRKSGRVSPKAKSTPHRNKS